MNTKKKTDSERRKEAYHSLQESQEQPLAAKDFTTPHARCYTGTDHTKYTTNQNSLFKSRDCLSSN